MRIKSLIILILINVVVTSGFVFAEAPITYSSTTSAWFLRQVLDLQRNPLTSYDSPLQQPMNYSGLLIQENFSAQKDQRQWIFRPSLEFKRQRYSLYPLERSKIEDHWEGRLNELYYQQDDTAERFWALGLQNYQWGPAELLSPSNPLYHFSTEAQDPSYQARGRSLVRVNYTPSGDLSAVGLFEFAPNEEKEFIYKARFVPKGLVKLEYRFTNPNDFVGLSFGREQMNDSFMGEYANIALLEGVSIYFDLKQTEVSKRYKPQLDDNLLPQMMLVDYQKSVYSLNLFGVRWETENWDVRWEEIVNQLGFSEVEMKQVMWSMSPTDHPQASENQKSFLNNGRELISKSYSYVSLRFPHLIAWLNSSVSLRGLQSHRDSSSQWTFHWEGTAGDHWSLFMNSQRSFGKDSSEMASLFKNKFNFAIKYVW